jgi:diguanylate cyclase (GGDEF)-like protein
MLQYTWTRKCWLKGVAMSILNMQETEAQRSFKLNMLIGIAGAVFLFVFGINALFDHKYVLAVNLHSMALLGLVSLVFMRFTGNPRYAAYGVSMISAYACLYLTASGGTDGTGPLWCYPLVVIIMFLMGLRAGAIVASGVTILICILIFVPSLPFTIADYAMSFKIRFISSFLALSIMAMIYEYLRAKSQAGYLQISAQLHAVSCTDQLTGIANRRAMQHTLDAEFARFNRHGVEFSILIVDVDYFKLVNDRYGHVVGDELLIEIARQFSSVLRKQDSPARWGGEEFLVILPQTTCEEARQVAEKLRRRIENIDRSQLGMQEQTTVSIGVQSISKAKDIDKLIGQADQLLYQAKHLGRNRVEYLLQSQAKN